MKSLCFLVLFVMVNACSSSKDSNTTASGQNGAPAVQTPDQAVQSLNAQDRSSLTQWQSKLLKTCDANEIFTGSSTATPSIDGAQLLLKNNNSVIVNGTQGDFVVLGNPTSPGDEEKTQYQTSSQAGSNTYSVNASTHYLNGTCEVTLYGQKIYSTTMISKMSVIAAYSASRLSAGAPPLAPVTTIPSSGPHSNTQITELQDTGFVTVLKNTLVPTNDSLKLVSTAFGMSDDQTKTFFALNPSDLSGVMTFDSLPQVSPFSLSDGDTILGTQSDIASLSQPNGQPQTLTATVVLGNLKLGTQTNSSDLPLLKFSMSVKSTPETGATAGKVDYTIKSLSLLPSQNYDDTKAIGCFTQRLALLNQANAVSTSPLRPDFGDIEDACDYLSADFDQAFLNSNSTLSLLLSKFNGFQPTPNFDYAGWSNELLVLSKKLSAQGINIQSKLDPNQTAPVIDKLSNFVSTIQSNLSQEAQLASEPGINESLIDMASSWIFSAQQQVDTSFLNRVMSAANNCINPFENSTKNFLNNLSSDPTSATNQAAIQFAQGISDDYKSAAKNLVASAQTTAFASTSSPDFTSATQTLATNFATQKLSDVIQKQTSIGELNASTAEINAAGNFAGRDQTRKGTNDAFFDDNLKNVVEKGLNEGWTDSNYQTLEAIASVAKYSDFCSQGSSASTLANCDNNFAAYSVSHGDFMDVSFGGRYSNAATVFQSALSKLSAQTFFADRDDLIRAFFGPIWNNCNNADFQTKLSNLNSLTDSLASADFSQQMQLEDQLRTSLENCAGSSFRN